MSKLKNDIPVSTVERLHFARRFELVTPKSLDDAVLHLHEMAARVEPHPLRRGEKLDMTLHKPDPETYALTFRFKRDLSRKVYYDNAIARALLYRDERTGQTVVRGAVRFARGYFLSVLSINAVTLFFWVAISLHPIFIPFALVLTGSSLIHWLGLFGDRRRLLNLLDVTLQRESRTAAPDEKAVTFG